MAGIAGTVEFEDALGIASFLVWSRQAPPPTEWCESLINKATDQINAGFLEGMI